MGVAFESADQLNLILSEKRQEGKKISLCHGVFDLLHPGHLEHFAQAALVGDLLVVSVTSDSFVNKGPGRPAFDLKTRMMALSRIAGIDFIIASNSQNAIMNIEKIKPDFYIKGIEYQKAENDITGMINQERDAVEKYGGKLVFTDGFTSSSTKLINEFLSNHNSATKEWVSKFRSKFSIQQVSEYLEKTAELKVGIVGEVILDKYTSCTALSKSSKDPILAFHKHESVELPGGVLAIANNCATWCNNVGVFSDSHLNPLQYHDVISQLDKKITYFSLENSTRPLIIKHRYFDQSSNIRLFETYEFDPASLNKVDEAAFIESLKRNLSDLDLVIVADYGHGLLTQECISTLSRESRFLCVNTQANAGNRGYNTIAKYPNANLICLNGSELQLELRDKNPDYFDIVPKYISQRNADYAILTLGGEGMLVFNSTGEYTKVPALASHVVDKVGAGDSVLAIGSLLAYLRAPIEVIGLLCSLVAAHEIGQLGHRTSLSKANLLKSVKGVLG